MAYEGGDYPEYVSAAERRRRVERQVRELERAGLAPSPVRIEGRHLANTFWGKAWCDHIESHADLATRLPRGRSYVRCGAVVDLKITAGEVRARVSGTELYEARVRLAPLPPARWEAVRRACTGKIANLVDLLAGELSGPVMQVLCDREAGIFPATEELDLDCSCPDGAWLCKHLAAVLYGIGARLDHAPELLFVLRGVDAEELVAAAGHAAAAVAGGGARQGPAALRPEELAGIFGIELEAGGRASLPPEPGAPSRRKPRGAKRTSRRSPPARHAARTGRTSRRAPKR